ncbi:DUF397 domain-containing protein [Streptomyces sp. TYQ1024]|nr:DUF397 domain-containing protein [Streptomyces sp. TYQ1024]
MPESSWRKSSYSNNDGTECVEVARRHDGAIPVRDSKRPQGAHLTLPAPAWATFVDALKERTLGG